MSGRAAAPRRMVVTGAHERWTEWVCCDRAGSALGAHDLGESYVKDGVPIPLVVHVVALARRMRLWMDGLCSNLSTNVRRHIVQVLQSKL